MPSQDLKQPCKPNGIVTSSTAAVRLCQGHHDMSGVSVFELKVVRRQMRLTELFTPGT